MSQKRIAILGSTGSIGTQTLDVVAAYPEMFRATVLVAGRNDKLLIEQCRKFSPALAVIADESRYQAVKSELEPLGIEVAAGADAVAQAMERDDFEMVVTATVGYSGLEPTIRAIRAGKDIALANKETLVVAGELITRLLKESKSRILPVDSEHSAIYQCLVGEDISTVSKLIITASGGPFRQFPADMLATVSVEDALRHPNWSMGSKITIDSATMMNKAFEIIEARWLFGLPAEKIEAVVHPQSIIHSMVQFNDGAVKAQLGTPDMRLPIRYALGDAQRYATTEPPLTLNHYRTLTFEEPDMERFPCLSLAQRALTEGGTTACVINAANEIAVASFLGGEIKFTDIYSTIDSTLLRIRRIDNPEYSDYVATNAQARAVASEIIKSRKIIL